MTKTFRSSRRVAVPALLLLGVSACFAEEGMWTFDNPPVKALQERYGFTPAPDWLEHVRLASVRFNDGGSGSFVGPHGLLLTNHHVAFGQLQKVSTPARDYVRDGFYARTPAEEMKCPDLELNVLVSMEDVTARVQGAVKAGMNDEQALKARKGEIASIEKESLDRTGLRSDVVSLYQGGEYWLYRYKKYTDVRIVFAPERQIAFFGGDPDNFTYPRYDLDFALFRVYENGKPIEAKHYLKWNARGAAEGELVFVSGHPGFTSRQDTLAQIEAERDVLMPFRVLSLERRLVALRAYAARGPEQSRQAAQRIFGLENSLKALRGIEKGLLDPGLTEKKGREEKEFRALVDRNPEWKSRYAPAWEETAKAEKELLSRAKAVSMHNLYRAPLANQALTVVQYAAEVKKPDADRLDGFHDAQLESLRFRLLSRAPVYREMEEVLLANLLEEARDELGPDDLFVRAALSSRDPREVARELIAGTKLDDPNVRKALVEGGEEAVRASNDPLVEYARRLDPIVRATHKWYEANVESVETEAGEKIGKARFAAYGKSAYPDATFTLRLAYGTVKGYPMNGTEAPTFTTLFGLYDRAEGFSLKPPFDLPQRFLDRRAKLDLSTRYNFVTTCDVVGGNSGSPVINRNAELVGLIFDGNIESLVGDFVYNEADNRSVAVHSAAIIEALRKLFDAGPLADELEGK